MHIEMRTSTEDDFKIIVIASDSGAAAFGFKEHCLSRNNARAHQDKQNGAREKN
jgi:hypothetical protein